MGQPMANDRLRSWIGWAALSIAVVLPTLALVPFGWLWLWQNGYFFYWLGAALAVSVAAFGVRVWLLRRAAAALRDDVTTKPAAPGSDVSSPREKAAREAVETMARTVDPEAITGREALTNLGLATVEAVARHLRPEAREPLWAFTVPEALTLIERVSQRLRPLVVANVPLGDRLTVGQVLQLYRWRSVIDVASSAYDIWRVVRLMNPVSAVTQEIRERLSKEMYAGLKDELAKRLLATFVREVGEAAIDLYSGRLAVPEAELPSGRLKAEAGPDPATSAPLRLLLAGRSGSGKSSLLNALANEIHAAADALPQTRAYTAYEVQRDGKPPVVLVDSPGLTRPEDQSALTSHADECDLILWVVAADRPDREMDRAGLAAIRAHFAARTERPAPPVVVVMTHVDRLRPFTEWSPPYDIANPSTPKARSIRDAMDAVAEDLGRPIADIVPVSLAPDRESYNVDLVWAKLVDALPAAKSASLMRRVAEARRATDWRRVLGQAVGAGRLAAGILLPDRSKG
jgi:predicted GTPase